MSFWSFGGPIDEGAEIGACTDRGRKEEPVVKSLMQDTVADWEGGSTDRFNFGLRKSSGRAAKGALNTRYLHFADFCLY